MVWHDPLHPANFLDRCGRLEDGRWQYDRLTDFGYATGYGQTKNEAKADAAIAAKQLIRQWTESHAN